MFVRSGQDEVISAYRGNDCLSDLTPDTRSVSTCRGATSFRRRPPLDCNYRPYQSFGLPVANLSPVSCLLFNDRLSFLSIPRYLERLDVHPSGFLSAPILAASSEPPRIATEAACPRLSACLRLRARAHSRPPFSSRAEPLQEKGIQDVEDMVYGGSYWSRRLSLLGTLLGTPR